MRGYLLDTHVLLWIAGDSELLSEKVKEIFLDDKNRIHVSMASIWEMAIKLSLKKLELSCSLSTFVDDHVLGNHIAILNIKSHHCYQAAKLPFYHRDPFDRMMIAQAMQEDLTLLSKDSALRKYDVALVF